MMGDFLSSNKVAFQGKRVLELMAANLRAVPLYVSLDHLWSP